MFIQTLRMENLSSSLLSMRLPGSSDVNPCTVRNERKRGKLGYVKVGAKYLYPYEEVQKYVENQKVVPKCETKSSDRDKLVPIGFPKNPGVQGQKIRGAAPGTISGLDKLVLRRLAQRTLGRRANSSLNG
jgi:hypothetical protein